MLNARTPSPGENIVALVDLIHQLVHFDSWRLGRVQGKSLISFACAPTADENLERERFFQCYRRQQRRADFRAIALVEDAGYPHAVTMTLTAPDGTDAMLVLLRDDLLGPFTDYEYRLLALAKGLCEECLASGFVAQEADESSAAIMARARPMLYVLDRSYRIVMGHRPEPDDGAELAPLSAGVADRLPEVLEKAVRLLTSEWAADPSKSAHGFTMPLPFLSIRVQNIDGPHDGFLAVTIERMRRRDILLRASKRFLITPRERDVVAYLLDGMRIDEIATILNIAPSTVNDHIKKLIDRTGAVNRSQMLGHILGWQGKKTRKLPGKSKRSPEGTND